MPANVVLTGLSRELIALRASRELEDGTYVNLGIGIPTLVSNWIAGRSIVTHSEIGALGIGPIAIEDEVDPDLINASGQPVTELPGASYFSIVESFNMIRGGHIDAAVLGALQVSEHGDLASWSNPERGLPRKLGNVGGSMDLAVGAKKVIVTMEHTTNDGQPKIVTECTYPLTATRVVKLVITNLAVIEVTLKGLLLREVYPGLTPEQVQSVTGAELKVAADLKDIQL
ncbi:MAG: 3-oxoacid CoA-transferase subunit B [Chloroflexota bacterium]